MSDQICLVTGANGGIGKAIALELAKRGATVVMVCRDPKRGQAALDEVKAQSGSASVDLMIADLSSQQSIRQLAATFKGKYPRLDVLINNAAVFTNTRTLTEDGLEAMFATNHLGYFLLSNLLLDSLRASAAARILNISAPSTSKLIFEDLQGEQQFSPLMAFGRSKMGNLLFTFALARRLESSSITVNAIHPGLVRSNLMRNANPILRVLSGIMSRPPDQAAQSMVKVALDPEFAGKRGLFFHKGSPITAPVYAHDQAVQDQLWKVSLALTHLSESV